MFQEQAAINRLFESSAADEQATKQIIVQFSDANSVAYCKF